MGLYTTSPFYSRTRVHVVLTRTHREEACPVFVICQVCHPRNTRISHLCGAPRLPGGALPRHSNPLPVQCQSTLSRLGFSTLLNGCMTGIPFDITPIPSLWIAIHRQVRAGICVRSGPRALEATRTREGEGDTTRGTAGKGRGMSVADRGRSRTRGGAVCRLNSFYLARTMEIQRSSSGCTAIEWWPSGNPVTNQGYKGCIRK